MKINNPDGSTIEHEDEPIKSDDRQTVVDSDEGHPPEWAERIRAIVREEVRAAALEFIRTLAVLNGWVTPGAWMQP